MAAGQPRHRLTRFLKSCFQRWTRSKRSHQKPSPPCLASSRHGISLSIRFQKWPGTVKYGPILKIKEGPTACWTCSSICVPNIFAWAANRMRSEQPQALLDRLPDALPHLVEFNYLPKFFSDRFLNFEFLSRFQSLKYNKVHHRLLSMHEARLIFENCKFFFVKAERTCQNIEIYRKKNLPDSFGVKWSCWVCQRKTVGQFGSKQMVWE